jgi:uncharacterized membrane protein
VNRAWNIGASIASAAFAVVVEPFDVVLAGSGTTPRYELPRKLQSASWAVVALDHRYPTYQNHWGYSVPV